MISKKDKEDLIRKLLSEGCTYREITETARTSPNEITRIQRKITDENTGANPDIKNKSICSRALELLQKGVPLIQVIIDLDIEPEQGKKFQDIYLDLLKKEKIMSFLKDGKDMSLKIQILEFLQENPQHFAEIKESIDIQVVIWERKAELNEIEDDIRGARILDNHYDSQLEHKRKKILALS